MIFLMVSRYFETANGCHPGVNENIPNKVGISKYRVTGNPLDRHAQ